MPKNPWNSYRQVATQTAPPGHLVLMLYDGALRFLHRSLVGFTLDDPAESIETINNNILRAQAILHELDMCLNLDGGGDLAMHLRRLYQYFDRRLMESNLEKTPAGIQEVIQRLGTLREAWACMLSGQPSDAPAMPSLASIRQLVPA